MSNDKNKNVSLGVSAGLGFLAGVLAAEMYRECKSNRNDDSNDDSTNTSNNINSKHIASSSLPSSRNLYIVHFNKTTGINYTLISQLSGTIDKEWKFLNTVSVYLTEDL